MATNRYALADYQVTITAPEGAPELVKNIVGDGIVIGGPGDNRLGTFVGQISINRTNDIWKTEGDATGSWVHTQSLDRTGTCSIDITQISDSIIKFAQLCQIYESIQDNAPGLDISVSSNNSDSSMPVATCSDCYITKIPEQVFTDTPQKQSWIFTCGLINFYA